MAQANEIEDIYPLAPLQYGLLFHTLEAPGSGVYVQQLSCELHGRFVPEVFRRAWQEVMDRHTVLRTAFVWQGLEEPLQVVYRRLDVPFLHEDWRSLSPAVQEERLAAYLAADLVRGFTPSEAPLLRLALFRRVEQVHQLVWTFHHLLLDGWSVLPVVQEVFAFYEAFEKGRDLWIERPRPFREYIEWVGLQNRSIAEEYWRSALAGFRVATPLALSGSGCAEEGHREQALRLSSQATAELRAFASVQQLTLNTVVQGLWALLLSRYSGEPDIVFGTVTSGRPESLPGVERMIGLLINTLPVRVQVADDTPVASWLRALQERLLEARQYEYIPLLDVRRLSEVPGGQPLFESLLTFENYPIEESMRETGSVLDVRSSRFHERTNYPLGLLAAPGRDMVLTAVYDPARFSSVAVIRLLGHCKTLLAAIVAAPDGRLADLPFFDEVERRQILDASNHAAVRYGEADRLLHELFRVRAEQAPEAVAVVCDGESLSYGELDARSNRLAHHLRGFGVGPEVAVGLLLERSLDLVVAILGVLKAGGVYVPIDPAYPGERIAFQLQDSASRVVVTQESLTAALPSLELARICIDDEALAACPSDPPPVAVSPESLAYVIYTSGSTGGPKGVGVSHANVARLFASCEERFGFSESEVWTLFHSYAFDFSVWELWGALLYGGRLVVVPYWVSRSPEAFHELLVSERVTVLSQTPSAFRQLIRAEEESSSAGELVLKWVVFGGEALESASLRPWVGRHGDERPRLINMYGITETTVHVTYRRVLGGEVESGAVSEIGEPLGDLELYVLDRRQHLAPLDVAGELCVGGAGLARGYLGRPELTAERFVPNPFSGRPGERLYRSGDLARRLASGGLEYLGRIDQQVKIRGFRIELGEIESALASHGSVRESAVVVQPGAGGEPRLVAYVACGGESLRADELRAFLTGSLPEYMVPAVFVVLEKLPLTANGKVDRRALPAPEGENAARFREPALRGPLEEMVADIWMEVLAVERVGSHDDFFLLGGHSLLATRAVSRLREAFQVEVTLPQLFAAPTPARMAETLGAILRQGEALQQTSIVRADRTREMPLSFAQQRLWFLDRLEPGGTAYNIPAAVRLAGPLDLTALERGLREIVRRHEVLRTTFTEVGGRPVQVIAADLDLRLGLVDLGDLSAPEREARARRLAAEDAGLPFDLARGPLLRVTLIRLAAADHVLVATTHHIVSDLWSTGLFIRELTALYGAFCRGEDSPLAELPIQYADFASWQRQWLQGEVLDVQLLYWRQQLAGASLDPGLPTDYPRPAEGGHRGASVDFHLPDETVAAVRDLGRREGVTLFMTLLAVFQALLQRYGGQDRVSLGTPIAGRNRVEVEDLIGFFVNMLVLRTDLSGDPGFPELLGRVREVCLGAYVHQDLPFERLVEALQPERAIGRSPLFQVAFVLQNAPVGELKLGAVQAAPLDFGEGSALFDATLRMRETERGLVGSLEYKLDLFATETISRLVDHFRNLLSGAVESPERRLSELPLLSAEEERQLLGSPARRYPAAAPLHRRFEQQAVRRPEAVAVVFDRDMLTYGELDARANRLAHHLRGLGVGPEVAVGLLLERSLDLVVAILGVLKAGGVYVPIDPAYPGERIAFQLRDCASRVVITQESLTAALPALGVPVVRLDLDAETLAACPSGPLPVAVSPENLAYVIYTSGSTGRPKGVGVSHANGVRLFASCEERFGFSESEVWTLFHSYAFDFSVWELWGALLYGGRLVVVPYWVSRSPEAFYELLVSERVTVLSQTPSAFRQLIRAEEESSSPGELVLKWVVFGGEALESASLRPWVARHGDDRPRLINMYGITETTVHVTYRQVLEGEVVAGAVSEIGEPLGDLELYVLDRGQRLSPLGVAGELCAGGAGLARGYLGRPELTAERFVPDPFSGRSGARLYRSGDLARRLASGGLEYLGRIDQQVKIRGFRIELGEIESSLAGHGSVRESAVVVQSGVGGESRLVAYVACGGESPTADELRAFLTGSLPEHMVPAVFVVLETLPLTANGKVDRRALPAPESDRPELSESYEAPRTPAERTLAGIWAEVLGLERVGVHDDFFDLGGHSLLATQVLSRVRDAFDVQLPLRTLFERSTVAGLAEAVEGAMPSEAALDELSAVLAELELMSDEEVREVLAESEDEKR